MSRKKKKTLAERYKPRTKLGASEVLDKARLPGISGCNTALTLLACLALPLVLFPTVLKLPLWIEVEIALACWWLIWTVTLSSILYWGTTVNEDFELKSLDLSSGASGVEFGAGGGEEGCLGILLAPIIALICIVIFSLLFEALLPAIAFLVYSVIRGMLAHVVNDTHNCKAHRARSIAWGSLWAFIYVIPLMMVVWGIQSLRS